MLRQRKGKQRRLPGFEGIDVVEQKPKYPQPRITRYRAPKKFELIYRPLDLNFKGQLNKWLISIQKESNYKKLLTGQQGKIVELYLFPQNRGKRWLNQKEVMKKVTGNPNSNLKKILVQAMLAVWSKNRK
ncbi:hypothetical protein KKH23_01495 [Patescibacteria group bacterium]|nr:hypothetical protein [Patescibacteria group bacterium]MBU0777165.1 hypothetical protein [Patescibacteria group bacterium]MBU0845860.1 hypothetical protein [Patescibacteria group bacterium]MBU0922887.1 hypothetical protein [Patescibacteria group bacterium]MBU1066380.1 hypothetical protein [Patescibacteria group bacterium]